jgi:hypothetical protein
VVVLKDTAVAGCTVMVSCWPLYTTKRTNSLSRGSAVERVKAVSGDRRDLAGVDYA